MATVSIKTFLKRIEDRLKYNDREAGLMRRLAKAQRREADASWVVMVLLCFIAAVVMTGQTVPDAIVMFSRITYSCLQVTSASLLTLTASAVDLVQASLDQLKV